MICEFCGLEIWLAPLPEPVVLISGPGKRHWRDKLGNICPKDGQKHSPKRVVASWENG